MTDDGLLELLAAVVNAVRRALDGLDDWAPAGARSGQYHLDVVADAVAVPLLLDAGLGVLSEESGSHHPERPLIVALDPVDGSTNASRHLPWYATSLCVLDESGPRVALVVNLATGERFSALRGKGAWCDGSVIQASGCRSVGDALVCLSGRPRRHGGWRQSRELGAAALDLCAVAAGRVDAFIPSFPGAHAPWDYLGGLLVCREAGAVVADASGRELVVTGWTDRRCIAAAATPELLDQVVAEQAGG